MSGPYLPGMQWDAPRLKLTYDEAAIANAAFQAGRESRDIAQVNGCEKHGNAELACRDCFDMLVRLAEDEAGRESVGQGAEASLCVTHGLPLREVVPPWYGCKAENMDARPCKRPKDTAQPPAPVQKFGRCPGCERLIGLSCAVCGPAAPVQQAEREAIAGALEQTVPEEGPVMALADEIRRGDFAPATQRAEPGLLEEVARYLWRDPDKMPDGIDQTYRRGLAGRLRSAARGRG